MRVLVINCGSSSIKYAVHEMPDERLLCKGVLARIAQTPSRLTSDHGHGPQTRDVDVEDHRQGVHVILDDLLHCREGWASEDSPVDAVGHRVVHGGSIKSEAALIDEYIISLIEAFAPMALLHNPKALAAIEAAMDRMPDVPHIACFDTAFHHTIPEVAYTYALPWRLHKEYGVRRYGFHGISFRFVSRRAAQMLHVPIDDLNAVACHLGNGCSIAAIRNGCSIDTSMGMTPLEGLVMGTRAGDIDPGIVFYLAGKGCDTAELETVLNEESGLLGVSETSGDMRDVLDAAQKGDTKAELAVDMFCYRLKRYIGAYLAILGEPHALIFTGGIGENAAEVRRRTCDGMGHLGIEIDTAGNEAAIGQEQDITGARGPVRILVIPTNEELAIARDVYQHLTTASAVAAGTGS